MRAWKASEFLNFGASGTGPYELPCFILIALIFITLIAMFAIRHPVIRIVDCAIMALSGAGGAIMYYLNQTAINATVTWGAMVLYIGAFVIGVALALFFAHKERELREIRQMAAERRKSRE